MARLKGRGQGTSAPSLGQPFLPYLDPGRQVEGQADRSVPDFGKLGDYLRVLAVPNRLELLHKLQLPLALNEIELGAVRPRQELRKERALSRQAVQQHLAKLQALGLVEGREGERGGRAVTEYVVNHARLFLVLEELRRLSLIRAVRGAAGEVTQPGAKGAPSVVLPPGAALALVNGPLEGTAFPLAGSGPWTVGREKDNDVALPYDPFASKRNTRVWRDGGRVWVQDLAGSRNGTRVNWRELGADEAVALAPGDTLGVGRSLLVLRGG